eukprot:TRINITY_DN24714_c0_g1_i1.p1 TRINITY_DN24714_c0_g1~~TRINITY_DN24714_c0_g1_i1.p1  ORF type:complete len:421 (+),score=144.80 TRINITY_DN24714_c0_g1_i1:62-1264(+)
MPEEAEAEPKKSKEQRAKEKEERRKEKEEKKRKRAEKKERAKEKKEKTAKLAAAAAAPVSIKNDISIPSAVESSLKRAEEEAELLAEIDQLKHEREILNQQIDTLREPIMEEAAAVQTIQTRVMVEEANLLRLKTANMNAKELRQSEATLLQNKVAELQAALDDEQQEHRLQEERLTSLNDENSRLRREVEEEKRKNEWQRLELRKSEKHHEDAMRDQRKLKQQARHTEELYDEVHATATDLKVQEEAFKTACLSLSSELARVKGRIADAQATLSTKGDHSELRREYEAKLKIWNSLEVPAKLKEDCDFMSHENKNLHINLEKARQEQEALQSCVEMLDRAMFRTATTKKMLMKENESLQNAMAQLTADAELLLEEEENWSTDSEHDSDFSDNDDYDDLM